MESHNTAPIGTDQFFNQKEQFLSRIRVTVRTIDPFVAGTNFHIATQGLIYNLLGQAKADLVREVHNFKGLKGFSFIPLQFKHYPLYTTKPKTIPPNREGRFELVFYEKKLFDIFVESYINVQCLNPVKSSMIEYMGQKLLVLNAEVLNGEAISAAQHAPEKVEVSFRTLTFYRIKDRPDEIRLKKKGRRLAEKTVLFPAPYQFLYSLQSKVKPYLALYGIPEISLDDLRSYVYLEDVPSYRVLTHLMKKRGKYEEMIRGFVGRVQYLFDAPANIRETLYKLFLLGSYFGNGSRTTLGFGQYKVKALDYSRATTNQ